VSCFDITIGDGPEARVVSGIEVFRIVDGLITETWNSSVQPGAWG
jgi:predicted SnoaL-like aldol condensation-catalyzing enzyme